MPAEYLRIALLHLAPRHGRTDANRAELLAAVATRGARLILAPELAVSGYWFENPEQAGAVAETHAGRTLTDLAALCRRLGIFCALGLLERDARTGLLHNSAFTLDPLGRIVARHRKQVAERQWATPGDPSPASLFETPWGRMGLLICADTYYGLPARTQVLQGADLLLVLANWPPGGVDPRVIWQARALENGVGLVACNRTGQDRGMDCRQSHSFAVTAQGRVLLDEVCATSTTFLLDLPLVDQRLSHTRRTALAGRRPDVWRSLGLDVNVPYDPRHLWGPLPDAPVNLGLGVAGGWPPGVSGPGLSFFLLPPGPASEEALARAQAGDWPARLILAGVGAQGPFLATRNGVACLGDKPCLLHPLDGFRAALARPEYLRHPEAAVALAKDGCDLIAVSCAALDADTRTILATRCLERVPVALVAPNEAALFLPPEGHLPWVESTRQGPGLLRARLDAAAYRHRQLFDRLDLDLLCGPSP